MTPVPGVIDCSGIPSGLCEAPVTLSSSSPLAFSAETTGGSWLSVVPYEKAIPALVAASVNPAGLPSGIYTGSIVLTEPVVNGQQTITVTLTVKAALSTVNIASVGNGASFAQSFAPGMLMSVFGAGLSTGSRQTVASAPLPPSSSSGTMVTISGIAAPLLYISPSQINLQIPYEVPTGTAVLTVFSGGQSDSIWLTIQAAAPGIFVDAQTGHIVPSETAPAGATIGFYVTGAGLVTPSEQTGNVPASGTTPVPNLPIVMTVGGVPVNPVYVGIPGWSIGILQINFTVPPTLAAGSQSVVVTIGGVPSPAALLTITPATQLPD